MQDVEVAVKGLGRESGLLQKGAPGAGLLVDDPAGLAARLKKEGGGQSRWTRTDDRDATAGRG